jgi:ABC-type arginine transport system permease subunit
MGKRRGGFVVVPIGATDEARAEIRAWGMRGMRIMRFTNLPAGLRVAFDGVSR